MTELENVQRWFTSILVKPGTLPDKIGLANNHYGLNHQQLINDSLKLSASEKIGIYARGYFYRLLECMMAEYPAIKKLMGDELFETFVRAYLVNVPSQSTDLFDLGRDFPAFLRASQSGQKSTMVEDVAIFDLPVEMAVLERMISEITRCKGTEQTSVLPATGEQLTWAYASADFKTNPALRLLRQQFALIDFVRKAYREEDAPVPQKKETLIAISRKNYHIRMQELEQWQWHFLQELQSSANYTDTIRTVADICGTPPHVLIADLLLWTPIAIDTGYIIPVNPC